MSLATECPLEEKRMIVSLDTSQMVSMLFVFIASLVTFQVIGCMLPVYVMVFLIGHARLIYVISPNCLVATL